jgi:hypothetical protein
MAINFFQEFYLPDQRVLIDDVVEWFFTAPTFADMEQYISKLPEGIQQTLIQAAGADMLERIYAEKLEFCKQGGLELFAKQLTEAEQLFYLDNLVKYSATSIVTRLIKDHPDLASLVFPAAANEWSRVFMSRMNLFFQFIALPDFFRVRVLLRSMYETFETTADLQDAVTQLGRLGAGIQERYNSNQKISESEKQTEKAILKTFRFFPDTYLEDLTKEGDTPEKTQLILDLNLAAQVILNISSKLTSHKELIFDSYEALLLGTLKEQNRAPVLAKLESERRKAFTLPSPTSEFGRMFMTIFTEDNIFAGLTPQRLQEAFAQVSPVLQEQFRTALYNYLANDISVEIISEPLPNEYVLNILDNISDSSMVQEKIEMLCAEMQNKEFEEIARKYMEQLYKIFTFLKGVKAINV